jgi:hypothetical protein
MSKYVDVKYTKWIRYHLQEDTNLDRIIEDLKHTYDPTDLLQVEEVIDYNEDLDADEYMPPKENQASTVEVYKGNHILVWENWEEV